MELLQRNSLAAARSNDPLTLLLHQLPSGGALSYSSRPHQVKKDEEIFWSDQAMAFALCSEAWPALQSKKACLLVTSQKHGMSVRLRPLQSQWRRGRRKRHPRTVHLLSCNFTLPGVCAAHVGGEQQGPGPTDYCGLPRPGKHGSAIALLPAAIECFGQGLDPEYVDLVEEMVSHLRDRQYLRCKIAGRRRERQDPGGDPAAGRPPQGRSLHLIAEL